MTKVVILLLQILRGDDMSQWDEGFVVGIQVGLQQGTADERFYILRQVSDNLPIATIPLSDDTDAFVSTHTSRLIEDTLPITVLTLTDSVNVVTVED